MLELLKGGENDKRTERRFLWFNDIASLTQTTIKTPRKWQRGVEGRVIGGIWV